MNIRFSPRIRAGCGVARWHLAGVLLVLSTAASGALALAQGSPESPVLSLDEAVSRALVSNRVVASAALDVSRAEFGFMGFLGMVSLVGVIVSHVIVLFDFIEEKHAEGEPLEQALLDAGIIRLRPVLITVGATVIALVPLAMHGGPLWEPMCYAQIGGLTAATFITLLLVPVIYAIFVRDLKIVRWETVSDSPREEATLGR